jgi:hypothetical protein
MLRDDKHAYPIQFAVCTHAYPILIYKFSSSQSRRHNAFLMEPPAGHPLENSYSFTSCCVSCVQERNRKSKAITNNKMPMRLAFITHRNATRGVVVLLERERTHKLPSGLGRVPWALPADILPLKMERSDLTRARVDILLQRVRGKSILRSRKTKAFANCGRGFPRTRTERVLLAGDEGGKTPDLRPPWMILHPIARKYNMRR